MKCIARNKKGHKIVEFYVNTPIVKLLAEKLGLTYQQYVMSLAEIKVKDVKEKIKRKKNGNTRIESKKASQENIR